MKNLILAYLFIAICNSTNAQPNNKITIGTIDTLDSKILNEKRAVWIYVPEQWDNNPKMRYPVVYLLDGGLHFYSVVGMTHQLSTANGNTICPKMIIVGIPNTDRNRDLTPTNNNDRPTSGGNEKFISFIENELFPYIDSKYPVAPYRMFIGHSFGGLTINTLVNHTNLFNSYVAIDPSLWWDKQKFLKETEKTLSQKKFNNVNLYLGIANSMVNEMDTIKVKADTSLRTIHIRSILEFNTYLRNNKQNGLNYQSKLYNNDDHGSVPLITEYDALHFIFDYHRLRLSYLDFMDTTMAFPIKVEKHYKIMSEKMGCLINPSENDINRYGYNGLSLKNYKIAEYFFKLNIKNYPESYNVYDSLGDYYIAIGDKPNAIINLKKALSIYDNTDTRQKLEKFQEH